MKNALAVGMAAFAFVYLLFFILTISTTIFSCHNIKRYNYIFLVQVGLLLATEANRGG